MTTTIFFRDPEGASFAAMRYNGDVTRVQGAFPWAVTFRPDEVM